MLRLVFAHGPLRAPTSSSAPGSEARALLRAGVVDDERGLEASLAVPAATRLGDVLSPWILVDLPHALEALVESFDDGATVEAAVPAAVRAELERHAPRTWQRLLTRTRVVQRDAAWRVSRAHGGLEITWQPAGDGVPVERTSPLLALADHLVRGRLPGLAEPPPAALALLRRVLAGRWLTRRLPPELTFDARRGALHLRLAPERAAVRELEASEGADGHALELELPGAPPLRLQAAPGAGVPPRVARAALAWLLAGPRADATLFLDGSGSEPAAPPSTASASETGTHVGSPPS